MIGINFQGQLGNQLFQYAVARIASERLRCALIVEPCGSWRRRLWNAATDNLNFEIFRVFPLSFSRLSHALGILEIVSERGNASLRRTMFPYLFEPNGVRETKGDMAYDPAIWDIQRGTWLRGWFQSPLYLAGWESEIRRWYHPSSNTLSGVRANLSTLPEAPTDMIAVHVRLGDYLTMRGPHGHPESGWTLPRPYYERALSRFSERAKIALFSDNPNAALAVLPRKPAWLSQASSDQSVDLFSMASFKSMIISNSSFSWWAAWLNSHPDKAIVAPEFHIGWRQRRWFPADIRVNEWTYI